MKVMLFTKSSDAALSLTAERVRRDYLTHGLDPELLDVDTPEGETQRGLYDVLTYPSLVVATDDGGQIAAWHGEAPTPDQVRHALGRL